MTGAKDTPVAGENRFVGNDQRRLEAYPVQDPADVPLEIFRFSSKGGTE
jgi:hypothetical protein